MDLDRGRYCDCMEAIARLMDGFDIPTEFQLNLLLDMHDALRSALKECNSDDNDQFLSGDCGNCHDCDDDFEDCK